MKKLHFYNSLLISVLVLSGCATFEDGMNKTSTEKSVYVESVCPVGTLNRFDEFFLITREVLVDSNENQKAMVNAAWISIKKFMDAEYMKNIPRGSKASMLADWKPDNSFEIVYVNGDQKFLVKARTDFSGYSGIITLGEMQVSDLHSGKTILVNIDVYQKRANGVLIGDYSWPLTFLGKQSKSDA